MKIAIDAMGGDDAPKQIVLGALDALKESHDSLELVLVGDENQIKQVISDARENMSNIEIVHTTQVIGMNESPVWGLRQKKDASIIKTVDLLKKKKVDAMFSAGNTGAVVAATKIKLGYLEGINRPAAATIMPTEEGINVLVDSGANVDSKAEHLLQFAVMGANYARDILKKNDPKIGLLSVGEEEIKGNEVTRSAHQLLKTSGLDFIGNVEGRDLFDKRPAFSKVPPKPTPTINGGQGFPPASFTVLTTKSTTPSCPSEGLSIPTRLIFSLPPPFGTTNMWTLSPGTMFICRTPGVLSPVFSLSSGSFRTERLKNASAVAFLTPLQTASSRLAPVRLTS